MNNKAHLRPKDFDSNGDIIPMACKEEKGDLISREALKEAIRNPNDKRYLSESIISLVFERIDNAPTVTDGIIAAIYDKYMSCDGQIHNDTANEIIKLIKENASLKKENASLKKALQDYD